MERAAALRSVNRLHATDQVQVVARAPHALFDIFRRAVAAAVIHDADSVRHKPQRLFDPVQQFGDVFPFVQNGQQDKYTPARNPEHPTQCISTHTAGQFARYWFSLMAVSCSIRKEAAPSPWGLLLAIRRRIRSPRFKSSQKAISRSSRTGCPAMSCQDISIHRGDGLQRRSIPIRAGI